MGSTDGVNIKAVGHGEKRFKQQEAGRIRAGLRDLNTGTESFLLPLRRDWWLDVPLLVLQLDQGPTCCGSVAPPDLDLGTLLTIWSFNDQWLSRRLPEICLASFCFSQVCFEPA